MTTLYGHSKDPLYIKKISLRLWTLQNEIEAIVAEMLQNDPEIAKNKIIDELTREYSANVISLNAEEAPAEESSEFEDDAEAAMAAAIAGGDEDSENSDDTDASADDMAAAMMGSSEPIAESSSPVKIKQRSPQIDPTRVAHGKTIISEIFMDGMHLFCTNKFILGSAIVVEFLVPKKFSITGVVTHIREVNMKTRVISDRKMIYRMMIDFTFLKAGERSLLREFLATIEPTGVSKAPPKEEEKEEAPEEDKDELEDLGL